MAKFEILKSLTADEKDDLPLLNEYYFPEVKLEEPDTFTNAYSRHNRKLQRILKSQMRGKKKIIEIGCGSGDLTIPLANRFPEKKFIAVEPTSVILYAVLKRDLHNAAQTKREYFELIKNYIPSKYRKHDEQNHPFRFRRLENIEFIPTDSFELAKNSWKSGLKGDFAYAAFVSNNYYYGARFTGDLDMFVGSLRNLTNDKYIIIDGDFNSRDISPFTKRNLCRDFRMVYKGLGKDYFMMIGKALP